MQKGC